MGGWFEKILVHVEVLDPLANGYSRKNLKSLLDLVDEDGAKSNAQRLFWRWLDKQRWRKMMPQTFPYPGSPACMYNIRGKATSLKLTKLTSAKGICGPVGSISSCPILHWGMAHVLTQRDVTCICQSKHFTLTSKVTDCFFNFMCMLRCTKEP